MPKALKKPLPDTQEMLCQHYAVTQDWKKAAELTGLSYRYVMNIVTKDGIRQRVAELLQKQTKQLEVKQHQVIAAAAALAFSDVTDVLHCERIDDFKALPPQVRQAIHSVEYDVALYRDPETGEITSRRYVKRVRMHPKHESIKLLALATRITVPLREREYEDKPALTGITYVTEMPKEDGDETATD